MAKTHSEDEASASEWARLHNWPCAEKAYEAGLAAGRAEGPTPIPTHLQPEDNPQSRAWDGKLSKEQAVKILDRACDRDNAWEMAIEDVLGFDDDATVVWPYPAFEDVIEAIERRAGALTSKPAAIEQLEERLAASQSECERMAVIIKRGQAAEGPLLDECSALREVLAGYVEAFPVALLEGSAEDGFPVMVCPCCGDDVMDDDMQEDASFHGDGCILIRGRALMGDTDPAPAEGYSDVLARSIQRFKMQDACVCDEGIACLEHPNPTDSSEDKPMLQARESRALLNVDAQPMFPPGTTHSTGTVGSAPPAPDDGWPPITDDEYGALLVIADDLRRDGSPLHGQALLRLLRKPPALTYPLPDKDENDD
jgi:hypothetical protein